MLYGTVNPFFLSVAAAAGLGASGLDVGGSRRQASSPPYLRVSFLTQRSLRLGVVGLVAGVRVGKATGVVYLPGLGFMWFLVRGGVGHWAPNLHLRLTLLNEVKCI